MRSPKRDMSQRRSSKADFQSDQETRWCPGLLSELRGALGDYGSPVPELRDRAATKIVFITGIGWPDGSPTTWTPTGCTASTAGPALATGLATARGDLSIWVVTGDGDSLSIGEPPDSRAPVQRPIKILLFNNQFHGLTKGQASPTSEIGKITKSTPFGVADHPFNPVALALGAEATFVARTIDRDRHHLTGVLRAAAQHEGAALIEIYQNCPVFNDGAFAALTDKELRDCTNPSGGGQADHVRPQVRARRDPGPGRLPGARRRRRGR